jgi:5S rRNA maturation endonuclease (ribonuclease M5)
MTSTVVDRLPHDCGTSKGLNVFHNEEDDSYSGYCFKCRTYVADPYGTMPPDYKPNPQKKTPEEIQAELKAIQRHPKKALVDRGLPLLASEHFNVTVALSESDGQTITAHHYPYCMNGELKGYKVRLVQSKKFFCLGSIASCDPFGWSQAMKSAHNSPQLFITEGETDAMALWQALYDNSKKSYSVISVPSGASSAKKLYPFVSDIKRKFKDVILVGDQDEAGAGLATELAKMLPEILIAKFELKDANDMYKAGRGEELVKAAMWDAKPPTSGKSLRSSDIWHLAEYIPEHGIPWVWDTLTAKTRGIRRGEVYYFGGAPKIGKSVVVNEIATHLIKTAGTPVFLVKPEESMGGTLKRLAGTAVDRIFYDPNVPFTPEDFDKGKKIIDDKAIIYDTYQDVKWEEVKQEIRHNVNVLGCRDVILDPLTCFTVGLSSSEVNDKLIKIASELATLAKELDFTAYCFCHLNNPQSGSPHDRGGKVLSSQFAGSRAMARFCHLMIGIEGNKDPELPEAERNTRKLVILEDRNFGESAVIPLYYNKATGRLLEFNQHKGVL